ncbi:cellulose biosynthesis cyclic di-GMP-binding regulatory protein BcsB [Clostridium sp. YIM B02505]|uniref:Cellulose biosynthesis cyclic di-GMP-binding regulatory protein BcsB n=1 Tax=Clostridium yunnanense TaxID=2800325 RepID=A0ABS1ESY0_9CLOT|nr:cellulose biosynthesis cyclic di-GMP-binding regulatory protein BcsB [Clostridium yunnanense]MBK1812506.1 cellulose biosynthesis cyclic di-GMP-binding regulatory protein BcsB [Clostridium yunnanense]
MNLGWFYKKLSFLMTFIFILISTQSPINKMQGAYAAENQLVDYTNITNEPNSDNFKRVDIGNDVVLKGTFASHNMYFDINKWWDVQSIDVNLFLSINQIIDQEKNASITCLLNGVPFYSSKINYNPKVEEQNFKVSIPKKLIKEGGNEFVIQAYCRVSDKPCDDDINNANWMTLSSKSNILINFKEKGISNSIDQFPYPFFRINENKVSNCIILVPDQYTDTDMTAALMLSTYFGGLSTSGDYKIDINRYSENIDKTDRDIIYIGSHNNMPNEIKNIYNQIQDFDYKNSALIKKTKSPFSKSDLRKSLIIISDNDSLRLKAATALMNNSLISQIYSDTLKIDVNTKVEFKNESIKSNITFSDLGIGDILLKGPFRKSGTISYSLPKNRVLSNGSKISLITRYSENLDFSKSLLTVFVNGIPIGSRKLEKAKANGDTVELNIPSNISKTNYIEINIVFDLELENYYCEQRNQETPWAVVTNISTLYLPTKEVSSYKFETYPSPYLINNKFNNTALIVPDNLSSNEISSLSHMFSYIGSGTSLSDGSFKVVRASKFNDQYKNMNLILYGTAKDNPIIKQINGNLWFKYNAEYNKFLSNEKLFLEEQYSNNIATFQFDISPFNKQCSLLVLTSPNKNILTESLLYLSSSKLSPKLIGDSAVIDKFGNLRTFKFKKDISEPAYEKIRNLDIQSKNFIIFFSLFLIFIITAISLYFIKNRKRK